MQGKRRSTCWNDDDDDTNVDDHDYEYKCSLWYTHIHTEKSLKRQEKTDLFIRNSFPNDKQGF